MGILNNELDRARKLAAQDEYVPGKGCSCAAWSKQECCCPGVDWRSEREVELEAEVVDLKDSLRVAAEALGQLTIAHNKLERYRYDAQYLVETNRWLLPDELKAAIKEGL